MSDIMKLITKNDDMKHEIYTLSNKIKELRDTIKKNERIIYLGCTHTWIYDSSGGPYDKIKYRCKICGLWRCDYMYS